MIFDEVRQMEGGFFALNTEVMDQIRAWHEETAGDLAPSTQPPPA